MKKYKHTVKKKRIQRKTQKGGNLKKDIITKIINDARWAAARAAAAAPQNGPGDQGAQQQQQVEERPAAASGAAMGVDACLESAQAPRPGRL